MHKIIRVDMTGKTVRVEDVPEKYRYLGGRALTSQIIYDEVPPTCDPLGPYNKIVIAPGILTGSAAPSSGRVSVGGKSPLTGGIKESNAGSPTSQKLGRLQIKAIIVEGQAEDGLYLLKVNKDDAELLPADELKGKRTREIKKALFEKYGDKVGFMTTGVAGDYKMSMAGICFSDSEGRASRYAGRGGLAAVLGSKGLKAMVVDDTDAPGVEIQDKELFKQGQRKLVDALRNQSVTKPGGSLNSFGTAVLVNLLNEAGGYPTRNFRSGEFEQANDTSGETLAETIEKRGGGTMGHTCHPGCIIQCSNIYPDEDGVEFTSCMEYESIWSLGANCGIGSLDSIAKLVDLCNEIGLDTIETGVTLGVAMDIGIIPFGDAEGAIRLMDEIRQGTPLGRILGNGAWFTGKAYGHTRVPVVKRQGMPAYEPRAVKGIGVTYITSPQGADHTAGYTVSPEILAVGGEVDPLTPEGKIELSRYFQALTAYIDSSGYCLFIIFPVVEIPSGMEGMVETVNAVLGTDWTLDEVSRRGMETLRVEWEFNQKAGFTKADDRPPDFMREEKLPPHNQVFDVSDEELDLIWKEFCG